ncbi:MAG: tetratricopeptide repeat protein, partial [Chloroflexi bacterium]|nr:tetratricopeptide repeat protein [Chloroflexota bacterium]
MAQIMLRNYLQETEDAISSERIDEALANCQNILKYFPESLEAQRLLGEVQLAQGHLEEAQHTFDWVLTNDPENVIAYCDRALICERKSDFDTALDCYQQAYELSRGNKQIREEFSKLSAKVGQQGFMFSRAGLARLYMRGDLLMQAIQEWEAVLAATPDRLDARTGLLEAYWRENLYNQAEEMAKDVLRDVPGCLKALLLLAYIASMGNMQQAQEYMQRAEALDPDLIMAQELFADVMASQPAHPFLKLLKKSPATLQILTGTAPNVSTPIAENGFALANGTLHPMNVPDLPASTDGVPTWNGFEQWNSESTVVARQDAPFQQDAAASPLWNNGSNPALDIPSKQGMPDFVAQLGNATANADVWNAFAQETAQPVQYEEPQFDAWQSLQVPQDDAASNLDLTKLEPAPWESLNRFSEPGIEGVDIWGSKVDTSKVEPAESGWSPLAQEESAPSPPAWLSMLTQGELQQLSGTMPAVQPVEKISPVSPPAASQLAEPVFGTQPSWGEEPKITSWADESKVAFSAPKPSWNEEPKAAPDAYTE